MKIVRERRKRQPLKTVLLMVLFVISATNCDNEIDVGLPEIEPEASFTVDDARSWFETNSSPVLSMKEGLGQVSMKSDNNGKGPKRFLQPDWTHAFTSTRGHLETVETHLRANFYQGRGNSASRAKWKETGNFGYMAPLSRLVVLRDRKKNTTESYIMTITGDIDYIESKNYKLWTNTYFKKDHNFAGTIRYHDLEGNFVNGWKMENGEVVGRFTQLDAMPMAPGDICTVHWETVITNQYCWTGLLVGEVNDELLHEWDATNCNVGSVGFNYLGTTCELTAQETQAYVNPWVIPGGAGGGGNQSGPTYAKAGMSLTMQTQINGNTCVTAVFEYINKELCGGSNNEGYYATAYFQDFNRNVFVDGVHVNHIEDFTNDHFNVQNPSLVVDAIDDGNVVMTNIASDIANSSHNVVIIGYDDNGNYIYMDPQKGHTETADISEFLWQYNYQISYCN